MSGQMVGGIVNNPGAWGKPPDVLRREVEARLTIDAVREQRRADLEAVRRAFEPAKREDGADG